MPKTVDIELMLKKARQALKKAYAPYSKFLVGACIFSNEGRLFCGCNIENGSYRMTICAEQAALANMIVAGDRKIDAVIVVTQSDMFITPCGACRQQLREFSDEKTKIYIFNRKGHCKKFNIAELLPAYNEPGFLE